MGTSGVYGGSSRGAWKRARQAMRDLPQDSGGNSGGSAAPDSDEALDPLWTAIADALSAEDPELQKPVPDAQSISISHLLPHLSSRPRNASSGGVGGGAQGVSRTAGRSGSGSRRQVVRGAARGGTALGAGFAVRQNDAAALSELGLDLERLRGLGPVRQCAAILDTVLGQGAHPDEYALRKASLESLKDILQSTTPPDEIEAVRGFVVNYVFELSLVELQAQLNAGAIDPIESARLEKGIRRYLERRVASISLPTEGQLKASDLRSMSVRLTREAISVIRARSEAA